ncbi:polyamine-modulated factor 1-binding protein 1-like [Macrobrachium rosenbergii]|uniref:polyamine-modulated factor 1-binding protein 1-like n=1 Tax=Macrobrachium rosenbergii TaxID=79674 RepID=UPI0034D532A3
MADQDKNKNYFLHIDELSRRLSADQRRLSEENHSCSVTEELLRENEKEYAQIRSELQYVQKSVEEYQKREQNYKHIKSLHSTLEMLEENTAIQDAEIALLEKELEALNLERDSLAKTYYSKLEETKKLLGPHLVDDSVTEKSLKRDHVMQQKEELKSEVAIVKKNYRTAALEDWQQFKAATLELAAKVVKLREEERERDICKQKSQNLDINIQKFKEEISAAQIAKQKQLEQRQQEFQQRQEQQRLQQQQLWQKNQGCFEVQQPLNWQSPQSSNIRSVSPRPCISMSPIRRQDTPRPKPYLSLSFSLPKLQLPKFGEKKISRSLEEPKRFEDVKFTDMKGGNRHFNSSVQFGAFGMSRIPSTSSESCCGPPSCTSSSTVTVEAGTLMHSSLGGSIEPVSQSHSAAPSIETTGSSCLTSLEEKIGIYSINVSGHSLASNALNRFKSNNTSVSNAELRSSCPYFEKAKRSLTFTPSQESEYSADSQKKRLCQSVPSVSRSESAELQRSSPSVTSSMSFQNKESWKVYMSSLLQTPEIVYKA